MVKKTIALVAHDAKKQSMLKLVKEFLNKLRKHNLVATATTGKLIKKKYGLKIKTMKSGPLGGDLQIGAMIAEDKLDILVFLRDPMTAQPHEPDIFALLRACDVHNIPLASNVATARILLGSIL